MSLRNPYARKREDLTDTARRIKTWVREALTLSNETAVTVSEINCRDPACPGVETAILVMIPHQPTRMIRIASPMTEVQPADIKTAIA